ncbi:MAG: alpha/beta hydrolase [Rhizomicrobium sp.]
MSGDSPPYVLVHGAYMGAWCWGPVASILRSRGCQVFTPTLTGLGERRHLMSPTIDIETFVADVMNVILFEDLSDIVLVGYSYGARSASGVADRVPNRIRKLVFIDGGLPIEATSRLDAMPPEERARRIASAVNFDGGISVPPPPAEQFGVPDPAIRDWMNRLMTPQPLSVDKTALKLSRPIGNGLPVTYVRCTDPPFPQVEHHAAYARARSDWRYTELAAGHAAIVTHPKQVADLLLNERTQGP